jgi:hypothetical protein
MKSIITLLLLLMLYSCSYIRLLGIKKEENETKNQINQYLGKKKILYNYSFELNDTIAYMMKNKKHRELKNDSTKYSLIQLRIYDSKGCLYSLYTQCLGDFKKKKFNPHLPEKNMYPFINSDLILKDEFELTTVKENELLTIIEKSKKVDNTIIVYWNIWTNSFSLRILKEVTKYIRKNPNNQIILINTARNK